MKKTKKPAGKKLIENLYEANVTGAVLKYQANKFSDTFTEKCYKVLRIFLFQPYCVCIASILEMSYSLWFEHFISFKMVRFFSLFSIYDVEIEFWNSIENCSCFCGFFSSFVIFALNFFRFDFF